MHDDAQSDNHIQQDKLINDNHKVLVFPGEYSGLEFTEKRKQNPDYFHKGRPQNVHQEGPQQPRERGSAHVDSDCGRVVLRRLQDGRNGLHSHKSRETHRNVDIRANDDHHNHNRLENVVHHGKRIAQSVDLRVAVRRNAVQNEQSYKNARAELDFFFLHIAGRVWPYHNQLMCDLPATGHQKHGNEQKRINTVRNERIDGH